MSLKTLITLVVCLVLLIGGAATTVGAAYQRGVEVRGWSDPAHEPNLPFRVPLAGVNVDLRQYDDATLTTELQRIAAAGFVWVRQSFDWQDIQPSAETFDFSAYDRIVSAVRKQPTVKIVAVLDTAPVWARRPDASDRLFAPPTSMSTFGAFAGKLADRYKDAIDYYQIWDEPNLNTHWGGLDPRPADYAAMLDAAHEAIHAADPVATVIAAGLAPTVEQGPRNLSDVSFLRALYEVGAKDSFDAAAGKPYGFDSSPLDRTVDTETLNFSRLILLREVMVKYGDGEKALWGSHFGWNSLPADWKGPPSIWGQVDAATQRQWTREAYTRADREWAWMGGLILAAWHPNAPADDPIQGFAVDQKAADWFENGAFFQKQAIGIGLHHPTDPRFRYQGDWEFGPLGADVKHLETKPNPPEDGSAHQLMFSFEGESLAFKVHRAAEPAFLYVRVDGQPANALPRSDKGDAYIIMKTPDLQDRIDLIVAAQGLGAGVHSVEGRFYLAWDQWVLAGIAVGSAPDVSRLNALIGIGMGAVLAGVLLAAWMLWRLPRIAVRRTTINGLAYLRRMTDILIGLAVSLLAMLGMAFTFRNILPDVFSRETPTIIATVLTAGLAFFSPSFILSAVALIALWLIIYNRPVVGLALIIFWAPFFLVPIQLYLWAFPMVEVSLALTVTAVLIRGLIDRARQRSTPVTPRAENSNASSLDLIMLCFAALATITLLWSEQRVPAIREWRVIVVEPVLFFFLFRRLRITSTELTRLVDVLLLAGTVIAMVGLIQYVSGGAVIAEEGTRRLKSVYGSPNNAALFLGRCLPFGLALVLMAPSLLRRAMAGLLSTIMLVAVVLTQSAGALLIGVPASLVVVLFLWRRRIGLIAVGLIIVGLLALIPLSSAVPRLRGLLDLSRSSSSTRTQIWTSTFYMLRDHPITGLGMDQFLYQYRSRYILPDAWREPDLSHPHNVVLDYWISLGIGGLVILAAQQWVFWRTGLRTLHKWRARDPLATALTIGALGSMTNFLGHGLVDNSYFVIDLAFVFCFTVALVTRLAATSKEATA
ncbi:MAG: O-antigen ligase family protein [Anaerolineae bacterium]|nr:O-antigen ligase family protein [Anaerolineae bacterium]